MISIEMNKWKKNKKKKKRGTLLVRRLSVCLTNEYDLHYIRTSITAGCLGQIMMNKKKKIKN